MQASKWIPLALIGAGIVAYANSFSGEFFFDDTATILHNPEVYRTWPVIKSRFLVTATFRLNYLLGGMNTADYHAVNLLIHIVIGLLLYGLIRRTLALPSMRDTYAGASIWIAALSACLWIVHPISTQSVTYICQRYESMMGMFYVLSLYCVASFLLPTSVSHSSAVSHSCTSQHSFQ